MILGFKQCFPWKKDKKPVPTNFKEKILAGVDIRSIVETIHRPDKEWFKPFITASLTNYKPKIHTIREDKHNRWKPGRSIEMVYRGPKYSVEDHFNKGVPELSTCTGLQRVHIWYTGVTGNLELNVMVDYKRLDNDSIALLAKNDGFDSVEDFKAWFKHDFTGKIIHWTQFRY